MNGELHEESTLNKETVKNEGKVVCVFGPSGIGKDTLLENLDIPSDSIVSVGGFLRENLSDIDSFSRSLEEDGIVYQEDDNIYSGSQLAELVKARYGKSRIPESVVKFALERIIENQTGDLYFPGMPRSVTELEALEQTVDTSRLVLVYLAPSGDTDDWRKEIGRRYQNRGRDAETPEHMTKREQQWREDTPQLLRLIHQKKYPFIHISLQPEDSVEEASSKLKEGLDRVTSLKS